MSFSSGGFGGFGSNNQTSSGFGGFGANKSGGFGSNNTGSFGQNTNTGGGVFGASNSNNHAGFGSTSGGFGSNTSGGFGSKPSFGSTNTASGGLFGSSNANNASSSAFGGFAKTNATSSPFGGGTSAGGGLFGNNANKTSGFGTSDTTSNSLFGGANTNSGSGFGIGGFGAANNPGLGGVGDPPGTASTPFTAFTEKEPNSTNITNAFQNIMFQEPYRKWSAEELRLADYLQGRRHGNASGAGAFGVSSGFGGGFGSNNQAPSAFGGASNNNTTSGGLFGSSNTNNASGSAFGQTGGSAFGSNIGNSAGGGLFGSNNKKPASGLFGSIPNQQQTGGLFGNASGGGFGTASSAFGGANSNSGGGLFGANNQANKPQGTSLSFGNANTNNSSSGFGAAAGGGFGSAGNTAGSGLFGSTNNNQQSGGGLFGNNQQEQQNSSTFGGGFGTQNQTQQSGGLFGNNQQKPAGSGLFGANTANTTSGGLFGNAGNQQQGTGGFGTNANTSTAGSLFGAVKPNTGTGLFGRTSNSQPTANTGTGLFGGLGSNTQNQQTSGSSLFGSANNAQQKSSGLFGSANQASGTSLFGGQNNQSQGSSLFGNNPNQQQAQNSGFGGSLLGSTQQANNAPQGLTANLNDVSAYGSPSLFSGVGGGDVPDPGPLATPLSNNTKPRRSSILPMHKLAPSAACRFTTPQKRGFGFSYSSYGTPGASPACSISNTPGTLGRSLLGPIHSSSLSKSMSTNNLRRSFNTEDSILAPGAFSSNSGARWYGSTGSKKLVINKDIRSDLFFTPQKDKQAGDGSSSPRKLAKRVSFDTSNVEAENGTPLRNVLPAPEGTPDSQANESTPRQSRAVIVANGSRNPEMEHVKGNELAIVHEEDNLAAPEATNSHAIDNTPGNYWTKPSTEELLNMNKMQRQRIDSFTAGRDNVGHITFKVPVDLSGIEIEDLCGDIIRLEPRSATVYPVAARKPPVGKGLNVPARIVLEQSWPRGVRDRRMASDPKRLSKHVERLKRIPDTTFEGYNQDTGTWVFSVEHFTTYGLDNSGDEESDAEILEAKTNVMSAHPQVTSTEISVDSSVQDRAQGDPTDMERGQAIPGAFEHQTGLDAANVVDKHSFLGPSSAGPTSNTVQLSLDDDCGSDMDDGYDVSEDEDMTSSSVGQHRTAEQDDISSENEPDSKRATPGGILRARMRAIKDSVGPLQLDVAHGDDWVEMLRKSVSPIKRDRQLLKEINESPSKLSGTLLGFVEDDDLRKSLMSGDSPSKRRKGNKPMARSQLVLDKDHGFSTSIDLINSLFEKPKLAWQSPRTSIPAKGFPQWPYARQDKLLTIDEPEQVFRDASWLSWGPGETLVVTRPLKTAQSEQPHRDNLGLLKFQRSGIQSQSQDVRMARFSTAPSKQYLRTQNGMTDICVVDEVPVATLHVARFRDMFHYQDLNDLANAHEKSVWELAGILFDHLDATNSAEEENLMRKTMLSQFWTDLVEPASTTNIGLASTSEEKAVACLAGHRIIEACKFMIEGKDFRLGTIVPLVGIRDAIKQDLREQLRAWHDAKMLSEFTDATRTIYELLSGNVCVCDGMKGVPIEDRLDSFVISKKFGLDWRQAFGLRLWYSTAQEEGIAEAVRKFNDDIDQGREDVPLPWYTEQGIQPVWNDTNSASRQDLLWGLLQLYAYKNFDLETVLRPENSQLSPLDARLSWQLGLALVSTGKVSFGPSSASKADSLTVAYAAQLTAAGEWLEAVFILLHLHDATARTKAIKELLSRHAERMMGDSGVALTTLTERLKIPAPWLWEAQALYMRSVKKDPSAEVQCLLWAGLLVEAHRVFVQQVAPQAIIERNYEALSNLIADFEGRQNAIAEWVSGGEIYSNFLELEQHRGRGEAVPLLLLERLMAGLKAMNDSIGEGELMRYAALSDMADETAREVWKLAKIKQDVELRIRILNLPLTQDRLLAYSVDFSRECYREVMSH